VHIILPLAKFDRGKLFIYLIFISIILYIISIIFLPYDILIIVNPSTILPGASTGKLIVANELLDIVIVAGKLASLTSTRADISISLEAANAPAVPPGTGTSFKLMDTLGSAPTT
jgi:hypothetical protein